MTWRWAVITVYHCISLYRSGNTARLATTLQNSLLNSAYRSENKQVYGMYTLYTYFKSAVENVFKRKRFHGPAAKWAYSAYSAYSRSRPNATPVFSQLVWATIFFLTYHYSSRKSVSSSSSAAKSASPSVFAASYCVKLNISSSVRPSFTNWSYSMFDR
eukprot:COSAG02_NODE_5740_length_4077_cov_12.821600_2_plen_159_part_00